MNLACFCSMSSFCFWISYTTIFPQDFMLNLVLTLKSDFPDDSLMFLLSSYESLAEKSLLQFLSPVLHNVSHYYWK